MFAMDGDKDSQAGQSQPNRPHPPSTLPVPPGLKAKPVIPAAQPFNMFANQQVSLMERHGRNAVTAYQQMPSMALLLELVQIDRGHAWLTLCS